MSNDGNQGLLGRLAVHKKLITMEQLVEATTEQGRFGNEALRLGEILVSKGFVSAAQLEQLLALQRAFVSELSGHAGEAAPAVPPVEVPPSPPAAAAPSSGEDSLELDLDRSGARSWSSFADSAPAASIPAATAPEASVPEPSAPAFAPPPAFAPAFAPPKAPSPSFEIDFKLDATLPAPAPTPEPEPEPAELLLEEEDAPLELASASSSAVPEREPPPSPAPAAGAAFAPTLVALSEPPGRAERLDAFLASAARRGASDVHVHPGSPAKIRVLGALVDASSELLEPRFCEEVLTEALNDAQRKLLQELGQIDFAYAISGIGRFRANLYRGQTGLNGVFRFVPSFVPSLVQLGLPTELSKLTTFHQGLVLVTGPAGCGKSTTLASLVNIINEERNDHILTIEDPVEYLHPSKRCLVNQRQVSRHTGSFARALRAALREDPDVIVIGELRDLETISLALTAAETGHLVLGTLHTGGAIRTVNRIIGAYPPDEQPQIRSMLSESLRAVLSQRLLPKKDGQGRVSALEVLHVNKAVANTVRENKAFQLRSMMQTGRAQGMLLLDQSLQDLVRAGVVSKEEAARHVEDPRFLQ